jgi:hypothetical protein
MLRQVVSNLFVDLLDIIKTDTYRDIPTAKLQLRIPAVMSLCAERRRSYLSTSSETISMETVRQRPSASALSIMETMTQSTDTAALKGLPKATKLFVPQQRMSLSQKNIRIYSRLVFTAMLPFTVVLT